VEDAKRGRQTLARLLTQDFSNEAIIWVGGRRRTQCHQRNHLHALGSAQELFRADREEA
jgi:hypothetical protein